MAISLTTDGLRLNYRTTAQTSVSGTYPIGTVIVTGYISNDSQTLTLPGIWGHHYSGRSDYGSPGPQVPQISIAIRLA